MGGVCTVAGAQLALLVWPLTSCQPWPPGCRRSSPLPRPAPRERFLPSLRCQPLQLRFILLCCCLSPRISQFSGERWFVSPESGV